MSVPIMFLSKTANNNGEIRNLNKRLINPNPKQIWNVGDVVWHYMPCSQRIAAGPMTNATTSKSSYCGFSDLTAGEGKSEVVAPCMEIFPSFDALYSVLMGQSIPEEPAVKGFAWFDFDGTLCAPVFQNEGKTVPGFLNEKWAEFSEKEGPKTYQYGIPVKPVIQYAKLLHEAGYRLGVLTAGNGKGEQLGKYAWLAQTGIGMLFEDVVFLEDPSMKKFFMLKHAKENGFCPNQIILVEDMYSNVLSATSADIVGIHISHIFTGIAGIPV